MSGQLRIVVACAESPGHAFPGIALARALRARGHEVLVQTSARWREIVEGLGLRCLASEDLASGPAEGPWVERSVAAVRSLTPAIREFHPDVVVSDVVAMAPPLAAEAVGVKRATLIALVYTLHPPGYPVYPLGLLPARTPIGRVVWRAAEPALKSVIPNPSWTRRVPALLNDARAELGLPPLRRRYGEISSFGHPLSEGLTMVATFPQLEYPRRWPAHVQVIGPMLFEPPHSEVELPQGEEPLVVVAPSTIQDTERLVDVTLEALAEEPVRVLATLSRAGRAWRGDVPDNAAVVDWVSHDQVMPRASLVLCAGGHGMIVRALSVGVPVLVSPGGGDQAENGARVTWAGAGLMLPARLLRQRSLRSAVRRVLGDPRYAARAQEIAAWCQEHDGAGRGAALVERYASR
jgi:UDP:flavonoid glycosyltransferase YjiC (YdhE family)